MLIAAPESTSTSQPSTTITSQPEQTDTLASTETVNVTPTLTPAVEITGDIWTSVVGESYASDTFIISTNKIMNFSLEVDVTINTSSSEFHGLMFRVQDNEKEFYNFRITPDGQFVFESWSELEDLLLFGPQESEFIVTGQGKTNRLKVIAVGSNFELYINGNKVSTVNDETYATGKIGLMSCACNGSSEASATFSNLEAVIFP
jgi:hypothetical protein